MLPTYVLVLLLFFIALYLLGLGLSSTVFIKLIYNKTYNIITLISFLLIVSFVSFGLLLCK